jgi:hypothetical protein
MVEMISFGT